MPAPRRAPTSPRLPRGRLGSRFLKPAAAAAAGGGAVTRGNTNGVDWTLNENASTASLACTLPTAMATGKLLVAHVGSTTTPTLPGTGSWQWASGMPITATGGTFFTGLAWTTDPSAGLTFTQASAGRMTVILVVYSGQDITVMDVAPSSVNQLATNTITVTGITTVTDGDMILTGWAINASTVTTVTQPTGYNLVARWTSGTGRGAAFADHPQTSQGATGNQTWTDDQGTSLAHVAYVAAIRAAPGGAGTNYTQTITDPVGLTDPATQTLTAIQQQTDPVGALDATAQVGAFAQAATDPVGLVDSMSQQLSGAGTQTNTDPVGLTDLAAQVAVYTRTLTDAVGLVDSRSQQSGTTGTLNHIITGDVTTSGFKVACRTTSVTSARLKVSTTSDLLTSPVFSSSATPDADGYAKLTISGLAAGTQYFYGVELDGTVAGTPQGSCKTQASGRGSFSFAFGSCHEETGLTADSAIYARALARNPDLFISNGDFGYWDITTNSPATFRSNWNTLVTFTNVRSVLEDLPFYYTWSDHDFGGNNSDNTSASNPAANLVYRQIFPSPTLEQATTGIYHSFTYRGARFIVTDNRSFKSPNTDADTSSKTVLGTTQKTWFKDLITSATEPLIFWVNEQPWIGTPFTPDDEWFAYSTERTELANHIQSSGKRVIILSGDMHALAADDGTNSPGRMPVFHAAPFHNLFSNKGGPYTVGPYPTSGASNIDQYGFVQVTDNGSGIDVAFTGYDTTDTAQVTLTVHDRTVTDSIGIADSRQISGAISVTITDPVGVSDTTSRVTAAAQTPTDSVGISDAGQASDVATSLTDPVGLTDSRTQQADSTRANTDPVGLTDSQVVFKGLDVVITDPVGTTDTASQQASYTPTVTDPAGISDPRTQQTDSVRAQTDPVGATDAATATKVLDVVVTDPVGITDATTDVQNYVLTLTDPVGLSDSQAQQFSGVTSLTITDPVGLVDSRVQEWATSQSVTDAVGLTDAANRLAAAQPQVTDSVGLLDATSQAAASQRTTTDPVGITDQATPLLGGPLIFNDPVGITDQVSYLLRDVTPRWVEHTATASGLVEGAAVGVGIVEGTSSL